MDSTCAMGFYRVCRSINGLTRMLSLKPCFVMITGDSDYITPVDIVRFELQKSVLVFNPRVDRISDLRYHASYYAHIPRDLPAKCQLPDIVTLPNGRTIHRPPAWS